jgi:short-chain Z-isoprenyl diphosphate synthase
VAARDLLYSAYERRLADQIDRTRIPQHVGVILDGNRRWARLAGQLDSAGHRRGGEKIAEFLGWCEEVGVSVVTLWLLSTDNLTRSAAELDDLLDVIESTVGALASTGRWRLHPMGALELLPDRTAHALQRAAEETADNDGIIVNVAVGYGGRHEITEAVRELLTEQATEGRTIAEVAAKLDTEQIARHLYTKGQPDPDLVIRTSGEQRLSGFLLWQSAHSEFYFCEALWPDFRHVDFLRALRDYANRDRRFGG